MTAPSFLIRGGRVVDPASGRDGVFDVFLKGEIIARVDKAIPPPAGAVVIEAKDKIVAPGLVDLCVHLRDNMQARRLLPDGQYERIRPQEGEPELNSQSWMIEHRGLWNEE